MKRLHSSTSRHAGKDRRRIGSRFVAALPRTALGVAVGALLLFLLNGGCVSVEQARYDVLRQDGAFELRAYEPRVVAETVVDATLEDAGNRAFRPLFRYISGANRGRARIAMTAPVEQAGDPEKLGMTAPVEQTRGPEKIAMTAPVEQTRGPEKLAMTAPVEQEPLDRGWRVAFVMPAGRTLEDLPEPEDPAVTLRAIPGGTMAAVRYSGTWSERRYRRHLEALREWMAGQDLSPAGEPVWARYNPPVTPWLLRRNEILIPVKPTP